MTPEQIYEIITTGPMKPMAAGLTEQQKLDISEYLGGRKLDSREVGAAKNMPNSCSSNPPIHDISGSSWNGWGATMSPTAASNRMCAGLSTGQVTRLKAGFGFPNATAMYMENVVDGISLPAPMPDTLFSRCEDGLRALVIQAAICSSQRSRHRSSKGRDEQVCSFLW